MRLVRLDLTRFGRFTDYSIDFGEVQAGEPDFHIIYGPNEAGKSTALAAFLDLLFGIESRSRFNFLHPYPAMRIGAALELSAGTQELFRVKRQHNSLLNSAEQPISDGVILGELGGIDREAYRIMFSLDDETLEAGGESILHSKGDLGQLLFSASAGLADLSRGLGEIRIEAEKFYKFRARSGELAELKGKLALLKEERERVDTMASQYAQLVGTRDRAASQYDEVIGQRGQIQARMTEIQRLLNVLPRLATLRDLRTGLANFATLPAAPPGWADELPGLMKDEVELAIRADGIEDQIAQVSLNLAAIVTDDAALGLVERVEDLSDLRARYVTAEKDIPARQLELREIELALSGILSRIDRPGEPNPDRLILRAGVTGTLRRLIEARSGVEAALRSTAHELSAAQRRLSEADERFTEAGGDPQIELTAAASIARLMTLVAALRLDDHAARRRLAVRSRAKQLEILANRIQELRPWGGDIEQLAVLVGPSSADIEQWKVATAAAQQAIERQEGEVERLTTGLLHLRAEVDAIGQVAGVVSDQESNGIRAARDQAWAVHRHSLDAATADAFEAALRHDDQVGSARFGHVADLAKLHQANQASRVTEADLGRAQHLLEEAKAELARVHDEIASALSTMTPGMPTDTTLLQLEAWISYRARALEAQELVLAAERDLREADDDAKVAVTRLSAALLVAGIPHDPAAGFDVLLEEAQVAIDRAAGLKVLRDTRVDLAREVKAREQDAVEAADRDQAWAGAWTKACSSCWLGSAGVTPEVETVREVLTIIVELGPTLEKRAGLVDRIAKMERDQAAFEDEIGAVARELRIPEAPGGVLELAREVTDRVHQAKIAQSEQAQKQEDLRSLQGRKRELARLTAIHAKRKLEMLTLFGVETLLDVGERLRSIEQKADLQGRSSRMEVEILDALRLSTIDAAERLLDGADRTLLEAELTELQGRFDDSDQRSRELFTAHSTAVDRVEAVGGDEAVAAIEEQRRTIRLDIEDRALRYLKLRVGAVAAEQALRVYRDRHRSSMMARASDAFRTISRGAYTGLASQPDKDSEILVAISADGGSKVASELSKGTRFQLYLALRVAGYHEFVQSRRPVPFIADDIMETFDDFRAEEAFRLFDSMARVGQVIYLTHHRHLCEIALRVCPNAKVHSIGGGAVT